MNNPLCKPVQPEVPTISLKDAMQYAANRGLKILTYKQNDQKIVEVTVPSTNLLTRRYIKQHETEHRALCCCIEQMKAELEKDLGVSI